MSHNISEYAFESAIMAALTGARGIMREPGTGYAQDYAPGGYYKRRAAAYDRARCLLPADTLDFILATQPKEWDRLKKHHGAEVREKFLTRLASEVKKRGTLDVLRRGVKDRGCKFAMAYFRPASGLNKKTQRLYEGNIFSVARQLTYSEQSEVALDLVLFLNGLPLFTAELKNPLTGQTWLDAIKQYRSPARDPREPLLAHGRCLAHFAVDPDEVHVTTKLEGPATRFLPFNRGKFGGKGNPPVPPTQPGRYPSSYLWEQAWSCDSVLNLIQHFIHEVDREDDRGRKTGESYLIFPRYQQLDAVRRLVSHARGHGAGQRYLIQHSAGSGKSFTIAWLAHQLSTLHDADDERVFDSIIVITDRRVLDRQLQRHVRQFQQTLGVVENIDKTSRQLKKALEDGKTIIVTTLQKFPVIAGQIAELAGQRFALIVDEAHSSQSGEQTKSLKSVLATPSATLGTGQDLVDAALEEEGIDGDEDPLETVIAREMALRGHLPNLSTFAFTATPKSRTLELFGQRQPDGSFAPFHVYTMRQAIEEGFILDVLQNYTTYKVYWKLLKTIADDPRYERRKAAYLLRQYVDLHEHAIGEKVAIMVDHFRNSVAHKIAGQAKAMVVTRSRLHAVRYKLAFDKYLAEQGLPYRVLVAFSGTVEDPTPLTEAGMNGFPDTQTAQAFARSEYRFLIVANKFQTGFDQPLLHTMYVDKKLGGVGAVQTLSRLNRTHPDKQETMVLDFANEAESIRKAFEPYYETTLLGEATDPNLLYDLQGRLHDFALYTEAEVAAYAALWFGDGPTIEQGPAPYYAILNPVKERFAALEEEEQVDFRGTVDDYVRLYAFLAQVIDWQDTDLEKLYQFLRRLARLIRGEPLELPHEVKENIDIDSFRVQETSKGKIGLKPGTGQLDPQQTKDAHGTVPDEVEPLSQIIAELNERFGLNLGPEHRVTLGQMMSMLGQDTGLEASARINNRENVRLTFDHKVENVIQEIVDSNFDLYKRITDNDAFGSALKNYLFDQFMRSHRDRSAAALIQQGESKTVEFKSTLRWNLREERKDDRVVTHAVLKTIAAFLNTDGGDLLIGVADDGTIIGVADDGTIIGTAADGFDTDDRFLLHLTNVVAEALGARAGTCIDPRMETVEGQRVCLVSCQRSPEPVYFAWKGINKQPDGDLYVRIGPQTRALSATDAAGYVATRFG